MLPAVDFSKAVSAVCSRQVSSFLSSLAQSSIMSRENSPQMMLSMCFWNNGAIKVFKSSASELATSLAGFERRSIMLVMPPCFKPSDTTSQPC